MKIIFKFTIYILSVLIVGILFAPVIPEKAYAYPPDITVGGTLRINARGGSFVPIKYCLIQLLPASSETPVLASAYTSYTDGSFCFDEIENPGYSLRVRVYSVAVSAGQWTMCLHKDGTDYPNAYKFNRTIPLDEMEEYTDASYDFSSTDSDAFWIKEDLELGIRFPAKCATSSFLSFPAHGLLQCAHCEG